MDDKYVKVTYRSDPIGKEQIVLELTTFDLETFKKDQKLEKIPEKKEVVCFEYEKSQLSNSMSETINQLNNRINKEIDLKYQRQIAEMKCFIEQLRVMKMAPVWYKEPNKEEIYDKLL